MNAIATAIKMETDAIKFYTEASNKVTSPAGKAMLVSIVEDEKRHLEMLQALQKAEHISTSTTTPLSKIKTVFETMKDEMMKRLQASDEDIEAFKVAMQMEQEGIKFYQKLAEEAMSDAEKSIFNFLIKEEQEHYKVFANTYNFLKDSGNWFMWEQRGIIEG